MKRNDSLIVCSRRAEQGGFAVVMVLSVIAILALLMTSLMTRNGQLLQRSMGKIHQSQAQAYLLGTEAWAKQILVDDIAQSNHDDLTENWAYPVPFLPVEGGVISGQMVDLAGRFNVNNLRTEEQPDPVWVAIFSQLLEQAEASPALVWPLVDWLDSGVEAHEGGLEDAVYYGRPQPYRSSNQEMVNISELGLVDGFDLPLVTKLTPWLSAVPGPTKINVNTSPRPVLEALSAIWMQPTLKVDELLKNRPWELMDDTPMANDTGQDSTLTGPQVSLQGKMNRLNMGTYISLKSRYFSLDARAQVGDQSTRLLATLARQPGKAQVLTRIWLPGD